MTPILSAIDIIGQKTIDWLQTIGRSMVFLSHAIASVFSKKIHFKQLFSQMYQIGVKSFSIVFLTGSFTGLALALQSYIGFSRVGALDFIGVIVTLGMSRELGPVLTGLMVTGRAGSAIAAEIGSMQISEQIDALRTLRVDPFQYLIVPRILAATIMMPFLTIFSMICGITGGYMYCVYVIGLNPEAYISTIHQYVVFSDITGGLIKAAFFGLILSWIGTYNGYRTTGGAQGVGYATTTSVVMGSILILMANYILSTLLFRTGIA